MHYVMHIPTGQFLYRRAPNVSSRRDRAWGDIEEELTPVACKVALYSDYERVNRPGVEFERITCTDETTLRKMLAGPLERIYFADNYSIDRTIDVIHEFTLIPIRE